MGIPLMVKDSLFLYDNINIKIYKSVKILYSPPSLNGLYDVTVKDRRFPNGETHLLGSNECVINLFDYGKQEENDNTNEVKVSITSALTDNTNKLIGYKYTSNNITTTKNLSKSPTLSIEEFTIQDFRDPGAELIFYGQGQGATRIRYRSQYYTKTVTIQQSVQSSFGAVTAKLNCSITPENFTIPSNSTKFTVKFTNGTITGPAGVTLSIPDEDKWDPNNGKTWGLEWMLKTPQENYTSLDDATYNFNYKSKFGEYWDSNYITVLPASFVVDVDLIKQGGKMTKLDVMNQLQYWEWHDNDGNVEFFWAAEGFTFSEDPAKREKILILQGTYPVVEEYYNYYYRITPGDAEFRYLYEGEHYTGEALIDKGYCGNFRYEDARETVRIEYKDNR